MEWNNIIGWLEYESIEHPLYEHYDDREFFDMNGNWVTSATDGYDFKMCEDVGYIHYWTDVSGQKEYILRVPRARFEDLVHDYLYEEGRRVMEAYEDWEYKDGVYIATRIVE